MNAKKLAKIFANLIFDPISVQKNNLTKCNHEIFEFFINNWVAPSPTSKASNNKNEQGIIFILIFVYFYFKFKLFAIYFKGKNHRVHFKT